MKRNKLYAANRWNQSAFIPDRNLFPDGGSTNPFGINLSAPTIPHYVNWSDPVQRARALGQTQSLVNNFATQAQGIIGASANQQAANFAPKENAVSNPFSFKDAFSKEGFQNGLKAGAGAAIGGLADVVGQVGGNFISGGLQSGAGSAISNIGGMVGSAISAVNPVLGGALKLGSQLIGGATNALWGTKVDQAKLDSANQGTNMLNNFNSSASSFDDVQGPQAVEAVGDAYSGGVFKKGWARRKNQALREDRKDAIAQAERSVENNVDNLTDDQMNNLLSGWYALGGDLQTHGGDFSDGLTIINAGLSHEENPNEGVQLGVDSEGTPNLVEEGETVYNDYVFSNRILADEATKQMFKLPKKKDVSFADISKKLEREIQERPNDPISKAGFNAQMQALEEQQERQKQDMEAERDKAAFEALSPEEQTALMQQRAEQEEMAQQAAEEQAMAEQQAIQQPSPEEVAMIQQPQMANGSNAAMAYTPEELAQSQQNVSALGGELVKAGDVKPNKFAIGGRKAKRIAKKYNEDWFKQMAKSLGISDKEMDGFKFTNDPEANLIAFNNIYRDSQYNKARDIYRKGQRQSKRNELFGDTGLYSYSDDRSKIYKARTNDSDRTGWINKDYTGATDAEGKMLGFLSQEEYDKLKPEEKEAYKRINERAGDRMYDYNGRIIKDLYNGTEDELLDGFNTDYDKGFKWDDKDAQTLQYPVGMEHSATSAMRYIPTIGGAIGLANDIFSSPDYSRPQAIIDASKGLATPSQVQPHYIGNYLTYRPLDIWYGQNALNAQSRAADRALMNTSGSNRGTAMAGLLANSYNSQLASGNLFRQAQEYNDALNQKKEDFNRGTNIFNANAGMDSQKTNAMLGQQAGRLGLQGLMTGYDMMDNIDARRQASMNANLTNVLQSLGNIGEEAYDEDRLRWLERTGTLKSSTFSANGGKLKKKKRGLII